ncbi:MAG: DUF192 domain-containing protein [Hyphomicrobiales bacterium]
MIMRYFFACLFSSLLFITAVFAQEPVELRLEQTVEISGKGKATRFCAHAADDPESRTIGLMFQENLPELGGMIFDFQETDIVHMWMRNTILSLDMVFISDTGKIVKIAKNTKPFSLEIISSDVPARSVLEINAGIADKYGLQVGDSVVVSATKCILP